MDASPGPAGILWTIGHSNHPLEAFLDLLTRHRIEVLVDVRSSPYSRYASQFNREALRQPLHDRAVQYLFLGDLLGGRVEDDRFYDDPGRVLLRSAGRHRPASARASSGCWAASGNIAWRFSAAKKTPPSATAGCWWAACCASAAYA